jgi:hypothetical protein
MSDIINETVDGVAQGVSDVISGTMDSVLSIFDI